MTTAARKLGQARGSAGAERDGPMRVIAIAAAKGGVAKTTSTLFLAARAAELLGSTAERPTVAMVDRDRDKHLTELIAARPDLRAPGVALMPNEDLPPAAMGIRLTLIDTPPGEGALPSLRESQLIVVPCLPTHLGINKLVSYLESVERQRLTVAPGMRLVALLPVMVKRTNTHRDGLAAIEAIAATHQPPLEVLPAIPNVDRIERPDLGAPDYDEVARKVLCYAALA